MAYSVSPADIDHYRRAVTGGFPECMEIYTDETPWIVPVICVSPCPTVLPGIVPWKKFDREIYSKVCCIFFK